MCTYSLPINVGAKDSLSHNTPVYSGRQAQLHVEGSSVPPFSHILMVQPMHIGSSCKNRIQVRYEAILKQPEVIIKLWFEMEMMPLVRKVKMRCVQL